jgi:UDPglucose--hexose-1-phosphate uridylyltransferase
LCPGNVRANGIANPDYLDTLVFENDYPALVSGEISTENAPASDRLFQQQAVGGTCRVLCFSARHDLTLARMSTSAIEKVVDVWVQQTCELGKQYKWVQVFENKGDVMGCSNPHPHGQIWASNYIPNIPGIEDARQAEYTQEFSSVLLLDYLQNEMNAQERIVVDTKYWLAVVPYWAAWPFEILLLPKRHVPGLPDLTGEERIDLAKAMKQLLTRYDNLFETSFPYSMGWHGAPFVDGDTGHWQLHAHFFPPLLRSASVKKFMVGYEMLAEAQRDITPEQAAERLRAVGSDCSGG